MTAQPDEPLGPYDSRLAAEAALEARERALRAYEDKR